MRFRARAKASDRGRRRGKDGAPTANPFVELDEASPAPARPSPDPVPPAPLRPHRPDRIVPGEPRPRRRIAPPAASRPPAASDPRADEAQAARASQAARARQADESSQSARAAEAGPSPRRRLRRLLVLAGLFLFFLPAVPVALLRFLPPPATAMMAHRWLEARSAGREFELHYDWVPKERIARPLSAAVVASEDQRFYDHAGFDWKELQNALDDWRDGGSLRGASTISQQVAKNLFLWPGRSFLRKLVEAWFTLWIEWLWPKERILEVYLNIAELGDGTFGAEAAAKRYFRHPAATLDAHEAALLAAMLPSPLRSNPRNPSAYLRERQRWILRQI